MAQLAHDLLQGVGHLGLGVLGAQLVLEDDGRALDDVDDTGEELALAQGVLDRVGVRAEALLHHAHHVHEVGADPVHLVDERDPRDPVTVSLAPHRLRLGLDATHGAEHGHGAIQHPQGPLHLGGEVHVPGGVDDVDAVVGAVPHPVRRRRSGGDGDPPLLLLLHPVHGRSAFMDLAHLVQPSRVEKDALGGRGLAGVDVRHDADVAQVRQWRNPWHLSRVLRLSFVVSFRPRHRSGRKKERGPYRRGPVRGPAAVRAHRDRRGPAGHRASQIVLLPP